MLMPREKWTTTQISVIFQPDAGYSKHTAHQFSGANGNAQRDKHNNTRENVQERNAKW